VDLVCILNAFGTSSSLLFLFYYGDIVCMLFIIQVDLDSRWGRILIGCVIKSQVRRRSGIWRRKHLMRGVGKILIGGKIVLLGLFNKTGMIGRLVARRFFDFIVLYGSPEEGARRDRKRDWVGLLRLNLGWRVGWLDSSSFLDFDCFDRVCFGLLCEELYVFCLVVIFVWISGFMLLCVCL
jgi:hypothetical protein